MQKINDAVFMREAIQVAQRGVGCVHPNPLVGAVLVRRGRIVGRGAHLYFGGPHAEVEAIRAAGKRSVGATLYVTLEPCGHYGKTPPCSDAILRSGVKRVVIGASDPHPLVRGHGVRALLAARIKVTPGVLSDECEKLNLDYRHWVRLRMPYVVGKIAQTLDGKVAPEKGSSRWITSEESRRFAHELRARCDAILVGVNTVIQDDPELTARRLGQPSLEPLKVVLDHQLRTPRRAKLFSSGKVLIFTTQDPAKCKRLADLAEIVRVPRRGNHSDWRAILKDLGRRGIVSLLIEGGPTVLGTAMAQNVVRELFCFVAPKILGGRSAGSVGNVGAQTLKQAKLLKRLHAWPLGPDWLLHGVF